MSREPLSHLRYLTEHWLTLAASILIVLTALIGSQAISPAAVHAAQVYCVGPGSGAAGCANPNQQDFTDINQALALASDGDVINVAVGSYGPITIVRSVQIVGGYPGGPNGYCCTANPVGSTITGQGGPAITVNGGSPSVTFINESDGVQVNAGSLNVSGNGTSEGNFNMANGATINFNSGLRYLDNGVTFTGAGAGVVNGATVSISGTVTAANFNVVSGPFATPAVQGPGTFQLNGTFTWTGGDIATQTVNIGSSATFHISGSNSKAQNGDTINNSGTAIEDGTGGFCQYGTTPSVWNNLAGSLFDSQVDSFVGEFCNGSGARTFINTGTFRKSGGTGTTYVDSDLTNTGTVDAQSGNILFGRFGAQFNNNAGAITLASGATVSFTNGNNALDDGSTSSGGGKLVIPGGTLTVNGNASVENLDLNGGALNVNGTLNLTNVLNWTGGSIGGSGTLNLGNTATTNITGGGGKSQIGNTINNSGTVVVSDAVGFCQYGASGSTFNNLLGALFDDQTDSNIGQFCNASGSRVFNNSGTFRKSGGTGTTEEQAAFVNNGIIDIQSGNVNFGNFGGTLTNNTTMSIGAGASATLRNNGHIFNDGSSVSGAGTVLVPGGLTTNGVVSIQNLGLNGGSVASNNTLNVTGTLTWTGGTINGPGAVNIAQGATLAIAPGGGKSQVSGTINNSGTTIMTDTGGFCQYGVPGATFNNNAGALFDDQVDTFIGEFCFASGSRIVNNAGTFQKSGGIGTTTVQATFTNTGTVLAESGTFSFTDSYTQNAGATTLNGGNLQLNQTLNLAGGSLSGTGTINGSVSNSSVLSPDIAAKASLAKRKPTPRASKSAATFSPGSITITGSYTQNAGGSLSIQVGGPTAGTQYDQLIVNGAVSLDGTLNLSLVNGYVPNDGDSFTPLTYASESGTFATVNQSGLGAGQSFILNYAPTSLVLVFAGMPTATPTATSTPTSTPTATSTPTNVPTSTPTPAPTVIRATDSRIQYDTWRGVNDSNASGGSYRVSKIAGARATLHLNGTSVTWVSLKGPDQGQAQVYIDGTSRGTFDMYSPSVQYNVANTFSGLSTGAHTLIVRVLGQKNASSTGTNVVVNAFQSGSGSVQANDIHIQYDTWAGASANGLSVRASSTGGAVAALKFTGTNVSWVTAMGPQYGIADVLIDGIDQGTIDLYSPTSQNVVQESYSGLSSGTHVIQVKPTGTKNPAASGANVVVEGFTVSTSSGGGGTAETSGGLDLAAMLHGMWNSLFGWLMPTRGVALR